jgi:cytochrome P450
MANYPLVESAFKALIPPSIGIKKRYEHHNFSKDRVTKRLEKGREHEGVDIWNLVLNKSEKRGLSRAEMDKNAGLFMIAGTETTATLVSGLTTLLLENSQAMKELTTEIRQAFETPADMSIEKCAALPYLNACLKEALRLYPYGAAASVPTGRFYHLRTLHSTGCRSSSHPWNQCLFI